jgi:hypothetical protein
MGAATPQRLGDFEIVREIGRGGMGVVYEARQVPLNRQVALKVLSGGLGLTPKAVQRFRREAEAAAKLHHTNIVPVYATGEEDGTHFYAMELIDGPSLDLVIRQLREASCRRHHPQGPHSVTQGLRFRSPPGQWSSRGRSAAWAVSRDAFRLLRRRALTHQETRMRRCRESAPPVRGRERDGHTLSHVGRMREQYKKLLQGVHRTAGNWSQEAS